jgi:hypothetical protein
MTVLRRGQFWQHRDDDVQHEDARTGGGCSRYEIGIQRFRQGSVALTTSRPSPYG